MTRRKKIEVMVESHIDIDEKLLGSVIDEFQQKLNKYSEIYSELTFQVEYPEYPGYERETYTLFGTRLENDKELAKRKKIEEGIKERKRQEKERQEEKEWEDYQKLKKKFEG